MSVNRNPLEFPEIVAVVASFVPGIQFFATVSKIFRGTCSVRIPRGGTCNLSSAFESTSCLHDCLSTTSGKRVMRSKGLGYLAASAIEQTVQLGDVLVSSIDCRPDYVDLKQAIICRNMLFLIWVQGLTDERDWDLVFAGLSSEGNVAGLNLMLFQLGYDPRRNRYAPACAAFHGQLQVLNFLRKRGCSMKGVVQALACQGNMKGLDWAGRNGIHCDRYTIECVEDNRIRSYLEAWRRGCNLCKCEVSSSP
ncbi:unknown [Feldmannia species virus]|uniref:Ankyrin repeat-containing protein n=1 Tax=Feldmannia species virus TaxID=39420 RepID=B5LW98_9PHYC|nr:hypothetical protein FeldSpV_gp009 [Feldmannia species virus]ACH46761.1 unknown [Feldmannia species virus]